MLINTNGNWLNWDVVAYLPQVCADCGVEELRRTLDGENEDLDDCTCEGHTLCYFPRRAQASKSAGGLKQASLPAGSSKQVNKKIKKEEVKT